MKIGILTITPTVGYGGIMQAYALQTLLHDITMADVEVINYRAKYTLKYRIAYLLRNIKVLLRRSDVFCYSPESEVRFLCSNTKKFINKNLRLSRPVCCGQSFVDYVNKNYDIVVVGSDQVWRPKYVHSIYDYFLRGVNTEIKKYAYAASLGVNHWEYSKEETDVCSRLLSNFSFVSVREKSAVTLVKNNLKYNKEVYWALDPTLMLSADNYTKLIKDEKHDSSYIFSYVLDDNEDKTNVVQQVMSAKGLKLCKFSTNGENYSLKIKQRVAPRVEDWLKGIYYSDFVVTDSFHGCVFSIIFNKPFVVYVNKDRGADRFESLLSLLGLSDRMLYNINDYNQDIITSEIDWGYVDRNISENNKQIIDKLKEL